MRSEESININLKNETVEEPPQDSFNKSNVLDHFIGVKMTQMTDKMCFDNDYDICMRVKDEVAQA